MLTILGSRSRFCDGVSRRNFLKIGALGLGGLTLPQLLRAEAQSGLTPGKSHKAVIMIFLPGGPAHQDIFDLKPDAPLEARGEFKPIRTNVPGIEICEHLPLCAQVADKYALIRSVTHEDNGHGSAMYANVTGWPHPRPNTNPVPAPEDYPAYGATISHLR